MASDINRVNLVGRLTKDPDLRYTQNGTSIGSFSIANNRTYVSNGEKKEQVSYFNCIAWGKAGEIIAQYMKKGQRMAVDGHLQQRSWEDKDGNKRYTVEVVVDNFQFLSQQSAGSQGGSPNSYGGDDMNQAPPQEDSAGGYDQNPGSNPFSDDDIPF